MTSTKRPSSSSPHDNSDTDTPSKRIRSSPPAASNKPKSLHEWLHPTAPETIITHSPGLHESNSTFLSFTLSFLPPSHITSLGNLEKECRRIIRELDVVSLVGKIVSEGDQGAFQNGEGRAPNRGKGSGREKVREPDHRMWCCRTLTLKEGKDGTGGEDDYQLLEASFDDNEKYGGQTILRALREHNGLDVLSVCCRWYGGDMIGPIRFQHITTTTLTSLKSTLKLMGLRDLRTNLESLDEEILSLRSSLASTTSNGNGNDDVGQSLPQSGKGKYDDIVDEKKLERLISARERTKEALEKKLAAGEHSLQG